MITPIEPETLFDFEPMDRSIEDLETPVPVIDFGVMVKNLKRWQAHAPSKS